MREDSGQTTAPSRGPKAREAIAVWVPADLADLARSCQFDCESAVEVHDYAQWKPKLLTELSVEPAVLLADYATLQKAGVDELREALSGLGKVVALATREDMKGFALPPMRGLDVVERDSGKELLTFKVNRALGEIAYDSQVVAIREDGTKRGEDLESLNEIGMALSTEQDLGSLLDLIVSKSRQMTWADAGSLYLIESDPNIPEDHRDYFKNKKMRFQVAQNDSRQVPFRSFVVEINKSSIYGYVALTQEPLSFADVYHVPPDVEYGWGGREFDASIAYRTMSMLTVPMVNYMGQTIGVIQLINRKVRPDIKLDDPETCVEFIQPFTEHDMRMAMSIASQASIAIQNTQLVDSIRTLFDGFIDASVRAIESRDPTTAGHSQRVATLTVGLAERIDGSDDPRFRDHRFTREQIQEIRYASLLHDFGKIGVREHVLVKAKKLYPHELRAVEDRFELIRTLAALRHALGKIKVIENGATPETKEVMVRHDEAFKNELQDVEELLGFIIRCNEPTVLAQGGFEQLHDIAKRAFARMDGNKLEYLTEKELVSLSVPRGSLTEQDRKEIESHVTHTYLFLSMIPWTSELRNVPDIAYAHHEKLDGTGYPNRLTAEQIPVQSKMMTVSDIFDALTASDRPYKKALPAERALSILMEEAKAGHIDPDLLEVFIQGGIYQMVLGDQ